MNLSAIYPRHNKQVREVKQKMIHDFTLQGAQDGVDEFWAYFIELPQVRTLLKIDELGGLCPRDINKPIEIYLTQIAGSVERDKQNTTNPMEHFTTAMTLFNLITAYNHEVIHRLIQLNPPKQPQTHSEEENIVHHITDIIDQHIYELPESYTTPL